MLLPMLPTCIEWGPPSGKRRRRSTSSARKGEFRGGDRFARHWHDVTRLNSAGFVDTAIADKALAGAVADHKLAADYQHMIDDGLFLDDAEPFAALLKRCRVIEQKVNSEQKSQ
jgi:hypothetical protein